MVEGHIDGEKSCVESLDLLHYKFELIILASLVFFLEVYLYFTTEIWGLGDLNLMRIEDILSFSF